MPPRLRRAAATLSLAFATTVVTAAAASPGDLRAKVLHAYDGVRSYRVTVLGSVRSLGVYVAPNKYQMTTMIEGKPIRTLIVGHDYWTLSDGKWEKSGTASNSLDVDIAGLLRIARADPHATFAAAPDQTQDGKRVGTFGFTFKNGTTETCNFDKSTYRATRCKSDELTLLYSGYNDVTNRVASPK